ncbi:MAG TPA: DNA-binding protein [Panacibacter sp.]|nr:DNA-binding protein [Panacibacter sp.]
MHNNLTHALRLKPNEDLKLSLQNFVLVNNIQAGWIVTCVGSLTQYNIRFANKPNGSNGKGYFEILSLAGTLSVNGCHLHICIADSEGKTIGGHLLDGCIIYTTAEIVIAESKEISFNREHDGTTEWKELLIKRP